MSNNTSSLVVVIPAAGVGKRMQANCPKQYLTINNKTILEHTVERFLSHPLIEFVVVALGVEDEYFPQTSLYTHPKVKTVIGGKERVDSVLAALNTINSTQYPWVMVHDAARPCVTHHDISQLIKHCYQAQCGGLLASPVRDTMKQANSAQGVNKTIDRSVLWHAFTPQMYPTAQLTSAINTALSDKITITDESSAIEYLGKQSLLVEGRSDNIKITRSDDLALATFILNQQNHLITNQQENTCV